MNIEQAVELIYTGLVSEESVPVKLRAYHELDRELLAQVQEALDFAIEYYKGEPLIPKKLAAALIVMKKGFRKSPHRQVYPHHIAKIFQLGIPNILMQSAYTFYILGLNLILATFSDQAVTALGLYYKWQTFFFIPLGAKKELT